MAAQGLLTASVIRVDVLENWMALAPLVVVVVVVAAVSSAHCWGVIPTA